MGTQGELTHLGAGSPCVDVRMYWSQRASQSWHVAGWVVHPSNGKEGRQEGTVGGGGRWYNSISVFTSFLFRGNS